MTDAALGRWNEIENAVARILVIEDDQSVSAAIKSLLTSYGWETVLTADAYQGVLASQTTAFDLVMIDIFIPGIDGLKAIKDFRKRLPLVPIIAMSGFRFRNSMSPALDILGIAAQVGANACLRKPFSPQQLIAAITAGLNPGFDHNHSRSQSQGQGSSQ